MRPPLALVGAGYKPEAAARLAGAELGRELGHALGELVGEALDVGRALEADVGLDGEGHEPPAVGAGPLAHRRDVADGAGGERQQHVGREAVLRLGHRVEVADDVGIDHDHPRPRPHDPLGAATAAALLHELDEPGPLELAQVVVHALAALPEAPGQHRGGGRLAKPSSTRRRSGESLARETSTAACTSGSQHSTNLFVKCSRWAFRVASPRWKASGPSSGSPSS
jgi:hypothetical protein